MLGAVYTWFAGLDPRIWQAVIAGTFLVAGYLFNGRLNRNEAERLRMMRLRDVHRALYAEIGNYLANLWDQTRNRDRITEDAAAILHRIETERGFVPFIPREHNDHVFDSIVEEIHVLPRQTIDPIVAYYSQIKAIANLAEDMRSSTYKDMPKGRRKAIYEDYIDMKKQAFSFGSYANHMINAYSEGAAAGANAAQRSWVAPKFGAGGINTPGAVPSGQSRGSV